MAETSVPSPPQVDIGQMANLFTPTAETIQTVDSSVANPSTYSITEASSPTFTSVSSVMVIIPRNGSVTITMNTAQPSVAEATPASLLIGGAETQDTIYTISAVMFGVATISSINITAGAGGCYIAIL